MGDYTAAERQKRWRERQKAKGKRNLTITISREIVDDLEKLRSGNNENLSDIIERAIVHFLNFNDRIQKDFHTQSNYTETLKQPLRDEVIHQIMSLHEKENLGFAEIARRLTADGIRTFTGKREWKGQTVSMLYKKEKIK